MSLKDYARSFKIRRMWTSVHKILFPSVASMCDVVHDLIDVEFAEDKVERAPLLHINGD